MPTVNSIPSTILISLLRNKRISFRHILKERANPKRKAKSLHLRLKKINLQEILTKEKRTSKKPWTDATSDMNWIKLKVYLTNQNKISQFVTQKTGNQDVWWQCLWYLLFWVFVCHSCVSLRRIQRGNFFFNFRYRVNLLNRFRVGEGAPMKKWY